MQDHASEQDFLVHAGDLSQVRWDSAQTRADQPLAPGEALLRVDRYGFSANNVTYAKLGDAMQYWRFFPAPDGWGRIPVWGHADVVASHVARLPEGARVYGYLPMSRYLRVQPERVTERGFSDGSAHRRGLPAIYQQYQRTPSDNLADDNLRALLSPLFGTAFLLDDWLCEHALFGAKRVIIASASSKTALATAFMLSKRRDRAFELVGLTSARNRGFCQARGHFDRVATYDTVRELDAAIPSVFIDMAGNRDVRQTVHEHCGAALRHSCLVGATHTQPAEPPLTTPLPGPAPELFFAPNQMQKRQQDWTRDGLSARVLKAQQAFFPVVRKWLQVVPASGRDAIEAVYRNVREGHVDPNQGFILSGSVL
jgi:Protein of unknown function (DUF2855)